MTPADNDWLEMISGSDVIPAEAIGANGLEEVPMLPLIYAYTTPDPVAIVIVLHDKFLPVPLSVNAWLIAELTP